jgi:membrane-anchored glycerophosphoryl diester phosphodiesterase (GDPDase)
MRAYIVIILCTLECSSTTSSLPSNLLIIYYTQGRTRINTTLTVTQHLLFLSSTLAHVSPNETLATQLNQTGMEKCEGFQNKKYHLSPSSARHFKIYQSVDGITHSTLHLLKPPKMNLGP